MTRAAALFLSRALMFLAAVAIVAGILTAACGLYLAAWPLRRAARGNPTFARVAALQGLLVALAGVAAAFRRE